MEGDLLPGKAETAEGRTQIRAAAMEELLALYEEGDALGDELLEGTVFTREESEQMFEQLRKLRSAAACITVDMLHLLLRKLRENGYSYCVSPYESDHQLVALYEDGIIDGVLSISQIIYIRREKGWTPSTHQIGH